MAVGMWIDRVTHGAMSTLAKHILAYQASFIVLAVVSSPVPEPTVSIKLTRVFQIIAPWMISVWSFLFSSHIC